MPEHLVNVLLPDGPDDDVAVLVARVDPPEGELGLTHRLAATETAVVQARHLVERHLREGELPRGLGEDTVLATSELVTGSLCGDQMATVTLSASTPRAVAPPLSPVNSGTHGGM